MNPKCCRCSKRLVWEPAMIRRGKKTPARLRIQRWRRTWSQQVAIRCLWYRRLFCPKCAERHFVHTQRVHNEIEKVIAKVSVAMLREVAKRACVDACSAGRRSERRSET